MGRRLAAAFVLGVVQLAAHSPTDARPATVARSTGGQRLPRGYSGWGLATELEVPVYDTYKAGGRVVGIVRRGSRVPLGRTKSYHQCSAFGLPGQWLKTPGGYVCTSRGVVMGGRPGRLDPPQPRVDPRAAIPFDYVKVTKAGVARYRRPSADPAHEIERQTKAFFLAKDRTFLRGGERWLRTVYGEHVLLRDTEPVEPTKLQGLALNAHRRLPVAFVFGPEDGVVIRCGEGDLLVECGRAAKHSHFKPVRRAMIGTREYVQSRRGRYYPAEYVRISKMVNRPEEVPEGVRWVHINLDEQTFVAYSGDVPHYTSLVSTGVVGRDTPEGLYRTQRKYITKTMRGPDETHGRYRVEEIPWVMYYHGAYAVHGAYWHDQFGEVRSHGCTNLAPADAHWLFEWDQTEIKTGWHANIAATDGLYFYFSRFEEELDES